ncbi:PE-PGRS family protein [Streptomyces tritici]|uniref:PE-PGRS family protein n=1 Tax=Streptomyces tritici TaxID=2054410 RepID=UPI003AF10830
MNDYAEWEALFEGGADLPWRVRYGWLEGLGFNGGAPDDVLVRLLGYGMDGFLPCAVSDEVFAAAVAHPNYKIRSRLAEWQPVLTTEQWTALVLDEPNFRVRGRFVTQAVAWEVRLPPEAHERLAADPAPGVRGAAVGLPGFPGPLLVALTTDPIWMVRQAACARAWPHLTPQQREALLADPHDRVRTAALLAHHRDHPMPRSVYASLEVPGALKATCRLEHDVAVEVARTGDDNARRALALTPDLDADVIAMLAEDPDHSVRLAVSLRPDLDEERRAALIPADFDPDGMRLDVPWVTERHDDPDEMRRLAGSVHPVLRSAVARAKRLPADVVERLARDEDRVVRLFLAESCDDAPADMLLEVWQWWTGSLSKPGRPRTHPNFPRAGLLRYADDPSPRMRQLALDDPESTPELVERFALDPDDEVRRRAAEDPRLSPESAVRLLDDADEGIRMLATLHPALPVPVLIGLLREPEGHGIPTAPRNPSIPGPVMHRMIDLAATGP